MVSDLKFLHFSFLIQQVFKHVANTKEWIVIVCPSPEAASGCAQYIASAIPAGTAFSGRTAVFPDQGRISVAIAQEPVFIPEGKEFTAAFMGWDGQDRSDGMTKWQDKAAKTFRFKS